jgi:transcriptional regulator
MRAKNEDVKNAGEKLRRFARFHILLDIPPAVTHTTHQASMGKAKDRSDGELVQGTLDMLILKTLSRGAQHGYGIAQFIQQVSEDVLRVEEGSLYPALHRLELDGMIDSEWGLSENNRRAKFYRLTAIGRKRLAKESDNWSRLAGAIARVMQTA